MAENHPYSNLAAIFMAAEMASAQGIPAKTEAIIKVTPVTPEPPPKITIEKAPSVSPVADPIIYLPSLVNREGLASPIGNTGAITAGKKAVIGKDFETGADIAVGDVERCGGFYVLGQPRTCLTAPQATY